MWSDILAQTLVSSLRLEGAALGAQLPTWCCAKSWRALNCALSVLRILDTLEDRAIVRDRRDEIESLGVCRGECRHRSGNLCLNTGDGLDATSQAQTNFRVEPVYLAPRELGATVRWRPA